MKKILILFLAFTTTFFAQKQDITLDDIWVNGTFRTQGLESFSAMNNGDFYTILNQNSFGTYLDKYDYATLKKVETIVTGNDLAGIKYFDDYTFSNDESKLIIGTDINKIYRHSKVGKYYVYHIKAKKLESISDLPIQEPTFSPDGNKIGFVYQNNLYIKNLETSKTTQISFDGEKNKIINGITDWVYEEEFSFVRAFDWNTTSDKIAYIRFDESEVPEFSMDIYGDNLYPSQEVFKYPKAGEKNSKVSLHLYNLNSEKNAVLNLGKNKQYYIPRIQWTKENNTLSVITLNRHQNNLNLLFVDGNTLQSRLVLNEKDAAFVDITDDLTFLKDNSFIWTSEKDGFNHIYHYSNSGKLINQITKGPWEITKYYGFNDRTKQIYFQSTEEGSINRSIYAIKINGKNKLKLSKSVGNNSAAFSNSFNYFISTYSSVSIPPLYTLVDAKTGKEIQEIKNNLNLSEKLNNYNLPLKEFSTIKTKNGEFNMWMIKPTDFDPNKEYPLLMFQYSGPGSQQVTNRWGNIWRHDYWHQMMADKNYIIVCVDGRGTGFKGRDFKKVTYKELGKYEIEDQIEAAKELGKRKYIDTKRIGIWGWSYGGYISSLAITKGADVFKMAIAVAPVTSWRFYDTVYTERYLQTPQENPSGYDENSPINFVSLLKGDYLLIHGTGDDNVHVQNSMRMVNALIKANKQFDYFSYPDRTHGIYEGENTRLHLFTKMTKFIDNSLGKSLNKETQIKK
ncbi:MAG: S9 family peptidase [Flavobacteriaceae bacterium]|nr:S9 family peptidase [Flavobacteriaceae bacterium]